MRLFVLSGRALPTCSISDVGLFHRGETRAISRGRVHSPRPCPPPSPQPRALSILVSRCPRRGTPACPPRTGGELATFTLLFKLAGRHHRQIIVLPAGRPDSARTSPPAGAGRSGRPGVAAPSTWSVTFGTKSRAPSSRPPSAPAPPRAAGPSQPPTAAPGSRRRGAPIHATGERPPAELGVPQTTGRAAWARPPGAALLASGRVSLSLSQPHRSGVGPASPGRMHPKGRLQAPHARQLAR